jgi:hypothetical protein
MTRSVDELDQILETAKAIERGERLDNRGGALRSTARTALDVHAVYLQEFLRLTESLRARGLGGFKITLTREPKEVVASHRWSDVDELGVYAVSDPELRHFLTLKRDLESSLEELGDLIQPRLPSGWLGRCDDDITNLDELRSYVASHDRWATIVDRRLGLASVQEVVLNVDTALREWGHWDRPAMPPPATTAMEAIQQFRTILQWLDSRVAADAGGSRKETTQERNERWIRQAAEASKLGISNARWCRENGIKYHTFRTVKKTGTRQKRAARAVK